MAHHEVAEVDVKKELLLSLVGIVAFVAVVALVAVSAFLRPAGEHPNLAELNKTDAIATEQSANTASAVASTEAVQETKTAVAQASEQIASNTGETANIQAPIASASQ